MVVKIPAYQDPDYWAHWHIRPDNTFEWIRKRTPVEWHLATQNISYDGDQNFLWWVISNPACELSTALSILWQGYPHESLSLYLKAGGDPTGVDVWQPGDNLAGQAGTFLLHREIIGRLNDNFYLSRTLSFDASSLANKSRLWHDENMRKIERTGLPRPWSLPTWASESILGKDAQSMSLYSIDNTYGIMWSMKHWEDNKQALMPK